ncbi:hypothetical protein [Lacihabitans soyangensis]|uniref:hypothetical protein n=1 Tax=Lacihabitans soyangensis TaxID=869394 RepID=UPI0020CB79E4|nr:hypothetical protein [Lacihabitans soyangensis]
MNLNESQIQSLLKVLMTGSFQKVPKSCEHFRLKSDLFGSTCLDCGKIISGKGFGATELDCIHVFEINIKNQQTCTYCGYPKDTTY